MNKLLLGIDLIKSMGIKPVAYRVIHTFKKKSGLLKKAFPVTPSDKNFITLDAWKSLPRQFFFNGRETMGQFTLNPTERALLTAEFQKLKEGYLKFFNGQYLYLGRDYNWIINPDTQYAYDLSRHWTELETLDEKKGDIKYVWEKSRFSYLHTLIRYDYHSGEDQAEYIFSEILSWIRKNPLNMGPNFSCSQEISIRILNWFFALYYYKNSPALTEERFHTILNSIYDQSRHVEAHLGFSLLTVRNNHAITECLLLYTVGLLCPFYKESSQWKEKGKKLLEQEGLYQIYEDGSYLQFSMNYERVVLQLYTWGFFLARANGERFSERLEERLGKVVQFLYQSQDEISGMLPNYGANDGALFFPLNNCSFRDYRPQITAMHSFLEGKSPYTHGPWEEDLFWFGNKASSEITEKPRTTSGFPGGGYYVLRDQEKFAFIRCGSHPDRPSQADNLHLDLWYKGENIMRDAGSFRYNTSREDIRFFMGTASHNTVMIQDHDQMLKGGRFLWFYWSEAQRAELTENENEIIFQGSIHAFKHISKEIIHHRTIRQSKKEVRWEIEDIVTGAPGRIRQIWNPGPAFERSGFRILTKDKEGNILTPEIQEGSYSSTYGVKEPSGQQIFETEGGCFHTVIYKE